MNKKENGEFRSRGPKRPVTISLKSIIIGAGLIISLVGGVIAHEDRYAKAEETKEIKKEV